MANHGHSGDVTTSSGETLRKSPGKDDHSSMS
jgi:hypothetical protein